MVFASFGAQRANLTANASELADIRGTALELVRELAHALNLDSKVLSSMLERFVLVASCDQNVVRGRLQHLTGKADALGGSDDRGGSHVAVPPFPWARKSPYDLPGWRASHANAAPGRSAALSSARPPVFSAPARLLSARDGAGEGFSSALSVSAVPPVVLCCGSQGVLPGCGPRVWTEPQTTNRRRTAEPGYAT